MSPYKIGAVVVIFMLLLGGGVWWKFVAAQEDILGVISPLAEEVLKKAAQQQVTFEKKTLDRYPANSHFPKSTTPQYTEVISVNAKAYAVMERTSGELLLAKNLTTELPIASVAKIMTALVVLEHADLDLELRVSSAAASVGEASMGLTADELVTVEDLLYGLMLPSGNDAAETLAEGLQGGKGGFMFTMNQKAQSLGLFDTFFFNPTGLDSDSLDTTSFSTPLDLLGLTNYALSIPKFAKIAATYYKEISYVEDKHKAFYLYNILQLDRSYPGIKGVKPGITEFAGETLVSYAENGGKQVIIVLLGTQNSRDEAVMLYDYIFAKLGVVVKR